MKPDLGDEARLKHILDAISEIDFLAKGYGNEQFLNDKKVKYSVAFQLQIIGEAANKISNEVQLNFASVNWREIIGLRNIIAHQYFGIDYERIWEIVSEDMDKLNENIHHILANIQK